MDLSSALDSLPNTLLPLKVPEQGRARYLTSDLSNAGRNYDLWQWLFTPGNRALSRQALLLILLILRLVCVNIISRAMKIIEQGGNWN